MGFSTMASTQNTFIQETVGLQPFDAIQLHHITRVQYFLKNGLDPDLCDHQQRTLLMCACSLTKEKTALQFSNLLLKHKARIDLADENGLNALHYAVLNEHQKLVARFLEFAGNFDINMRDKEGNTALMLAVFTKNYHIVEMIVPCLRKYDLSVDVSNCEEITPLIQATLMHEYEIAQCLIDIGKASLQSRDKHFRKSAKDWELVTDPSMYEYVLKGSSTYSKIGTPSIQRNPATYRDILKEFNPHTSIRNPTLKRAILRNPLQYINYPSYITSQSPPVLRPDSKEKQSISKDSKYRYPDLKPVYNLYEQELASSYRKSAPPRAKTPPPSSSDSSSESQTSWGKTILALKLKQRRHTIALSRSLPNNISTKNYFRSPGLPMAGNQARSYSLGTSDAIFNSSKWSALRQTRRSSFRLPYGASVPATAPGGMVSNHRRSHSISGDFPQNVQKRSVSFQSLANGYNDILSQSPRTQRSSLKYNERTGEGGYQTSGETQSPILEEDILRLRDD